MMQEGPNKDDLHILQLRRRSIDRTKVSDTPSRKRRPEQDSAVLEEKSGSPRRLKNSREATVDLSSSAQERLSNAISALEELSSGVDSPPIPSDPIGKEIVKHANEIRKKHPERKLRILAQQGHNIAEMPGPLPSPYEDSKGEKLSYSERAEIMRKKLAASK